MNKLETTEDRVTGAASADGPDGPDGLDGMGSTGTSLAEDSVTAPAAATETGLATLATAKETGPESSWSGRPEPLENACRPKAAYIATVYSHLAAFHLPFMEDLREAGYEVHAYAYPDGHKELVEQAGFACRDVPFSRSPVSPGNLKALLAMRRYFRLEGYELVHVHTPNAGFVARIAAAWAGTGNVYYTAHGFHFYKGAPLLNWLLYYPFERLAARWTDVLITINNEDFGRASRFRLRGRAVQLPGVGVEEGYGQTMGPDERQALYRELHLPEKAFVLLCMAELNGNKNQEQLLRAVKELAGGGVPVYCLLAGEGGHEARYRQLAEELGIQESVRFLGFRRDGSRLMAAADVVVLLSKREGLPKVLLEALSAGKPAVVTDVRGCRDLVAQGCNGLRVSVGNVAETARALNMLYRDPELRYRMGAESRSRYAAYRLERVRGLMSSCYRGGGRRMTPLFGVPRVTITAKEEEIP